jgi:hypothetical protein
MMKRAGRGHDPSGVKGTHQGELALQCRACPQDGKNLPEGWDKINWDAMPEDLRFVNVIKSFARTDRRPQIQILPIPSQGL